MSYKKRQPQSLPAAVSPTPTDNRDLANPVTGPEPVRSDPVLERVARYWASEDYERAVELLRTAGRAAHIRNALGVCLLRAGRSAEAVRVLRELVLQPGTTWMRRDLPVSYKINFAAALLATGRPQGCLEMLAELEAAESATISQLREAVHRWASNLPLWQRLNWKFGRIEPRECRVPVDFPLGELDLPVQTRAANSVGDITPAAVRTAL